MPVALVTGGSRGIGRAITLALAAAGYDVAIVYNSNRQAADEVVAAVGALGRKAVAFACNIGDSAGRVALVAAVREAFGRLDLLVNNAGMAPAVRADILEASEESFDQQIGVNLKGPYFLTQLVARWMIEQVDDGASVAPRIVTISSVSAFAASTNRGDYCVSKAGLAMMTKLFAARLAPHGIGVYEIQPGVIATDMTAGVKEKYDSLFAQGLTPIARWGQPEDVAKAVVAIATGLLPYSTGETIRVDGGFHLHRL